MISQSELDNWFVYHSPRPGQQERYQAIREAAKRFAEIVVENSAPSADQTAAVRKIREAVMTANQGIACESEDTSVGMAIRLGVPKAHVGPSLLRAAWTPPGESPKDPEPQP